MHDDAWVRMTSVFAVPFAALTMASYVMSAF